MGQYRSWSCLEHPYACQICALAFSSIHPQLCLLPVMFCRDQNPVFPRGEGSQERGNYEWDWCLINLSRISWWRTRRNLFETIRWCLFPRHSCYESARYWCQLWLYVHQPRGDSKGMVWRKMESKRFWICTKMPDIIPSWGISMLVLQKALHLIMELVDGWKWKCLPHWQYQWALEVWPGEPPGDPVQAALPAPAPVPCGSLHSQALWSLCMQTREIQPGDSLWSWQGLIFWLFWRWWEKVWPQRRLSCLYLEGPGFTCWSRETCYWEEGAGVHRDLLDDRDRWDTKTNLSNIVSSYIFLSVFMFMFCVPLFTACEHLFLC